MDMATDMEYQNIPLPTSRPGTPELLTPCEKLIQIDKNLRKYLLLTQGTEQTLKLLAPNMKADEPEVIDLFARLKFYQEQHHNAECEYGTLSCNTPGCTVNGTPPPPPYFRNKSFRLFQFLTPTKERITMTIVRVQYFVRGGFVGHRSRVSSKHLSSHLPVDGVRFLGGQKGVALQLQDARVGVGSNKDAYRC
ncbi:uncharacterized protein TNCV_4779071 [Trichonephila clavipes]|nr:uncharacterized protein TNCV_4779071 [Trichonephila clavipes]